MAIYGNYITTTSYKLNIIHDNLPYYVNGQISYKNYTCYHLKISIKGILNYYKNTFPIG